MSMSQGDPELKCQLFKVNFSISGFGDCCGRLFSKLTSYVQTTTLNEHTNERVMEIV